MSEDAADRLMKMLDVGLEALRNGDGDGTLLALSEAQKIADALPKRADVICLPDRSAK